MSYKEDTKIPEIASLLNFRKNFDSIKGGFTYNCEKKN